MTITLNETSLLANALNIEEAMVLYMIHKGTKLLDTIANLEDKGYLIYNRNTSMLTDEGYNILKIISEAGNVANTISIKPLALSLKEIYPKGKKDNKYYWAEGVALIEKRLRLFYRKYGNDFTEEEIIQATKSYVESFRGDTKYMKLLKYFIFKEEVKDGMVESSSDLYTILESKRNGEESSVGYSDNWTDELL